eukprot:1160641-Pelagomonas_calceolata.AAC.9
MGGAVQNQRGKQYTNNTPALAHTYTRTHARKHTAYIKIRTWTARRHASTGEVSVRPQPFRTGSPMTSKKSSKWAAKDPPPLMTGRPGQPLRTARLQEDKGHALELQKVTEVQAFRCTRTCSRACKRTCSFDLSRYFSVRPRSQTPMIWPVMNAASQGQTGGDLTAGEGLTNETQQKSYNTEIKPAFGSEKGHQQSRARSGKHRHCEALKNGKMATYKNIALYILEA